MPWTDGRAVPSGENLENLGPTWYGHSVAHWEGDTLVVRTTGLDERAWLDNNGNPKSFNAVIEERYTRTGPDQIDFTFKMDDPKFYTAPWVSAKKTYKRIPTAEVTYSGYKGLYSGKELDAVYLPPVSAGVSPAGPATAPRIGRGARPGHGARAGSGRPPAPAGYCR